MSVAPPRPKDMSLVALRALEASVRLGGFVTAGLELGITAGAVSAHIKTLEAQLGAELFTRTARGVAPTPLALAQLASLSAAFDSLGMAAAQLRQAAAPEVVHIATLPALAQLWLSPLLPELRRAEPMIRLSITALEQPVNLKRTPFDLNLFYSDRDGQAVSHDEIFPVCAPQLAAQIQRVEDLADLPCLSDTTWGDDWATWLSAVAPEAAITPRGPTYSLYALGVEEAINGGGMLMGHRALVARPMAEGRLVEPFARRVALRKGLHLWSSGALAPKSAAAKTARWLAQHGNF